MYTHCRERGPMGGQIWGGGKTCFPGESRHRVEGESQAAVPSPRPPLSQLQEPQGGHRKDGLPCARRAVALEKACRLAPATSHRQRSRQWEQRSRQSPGSRGMRGLRSSCRGWGPSSVGAAGPPAAVCEWRECRQPSSAFAPLPLPTPRLRFPASESQRVNREAPSSPVKTAHGFPLLHEGTGPGRGQQWPQSHGRSAATSHRIQVS